MTRTSNPPLSHQRRLARGERVLAFCWSHGVVGLRYERAVLSLSRAVDGARHATRRIGIAERRIRLGRMPSRSAYRLPPDQLIVELTAARARHEARIDYWIGHLDLPHRLLFRNQPRTLRHWLAASSPGWGMRDPFVNPEAGRFVPDPSWDLPPVVAEVPEAPGKFTGPSSSRLAMWVNALDGS